NLDGCLGRAGRARRLPAVASRSGRLSEIAKTAALHHSALTTGSAAGGTGARVAKSCTCHQPPLAGRSAATTWPARRLERAHGGERRGFVGSQGFAGPIWVTETTDLDGRWRLWCVQTHWGDRIRRPHRLVNLRRLDRDYIRRCHARRGRNHGRPYFARLRGN